MSTNIEFSRPRGKSLSILSDGKFHMTVNEDTDGAIKREFETSDGKKGHKWELVANSVTGVISNLEIIDGEYCKQLVISMGTPGEDNYTSIYLSTQSNFGEDFMKKLPNITANSVVKLTPFSFTDDKGKKKKGISIFMGDNKLASAYHVDKKATNGYPEIPEESKDWDSEDWKLYFGQARKFLIEQVKKHPLFNLATKTEAMAPAVIPENYPTEQISPDDIPF